MATYLVTGAAGFIASKVAEMLLADGHTVVGVDNLNDYYDVRLKDYRLAQLTPKPGFSFHRLDIEDLPGLERIFTAHRFDAVFNLAARAGVRASLEQPELYRRTNVAGEANVLQCQVKYGVKKHVLASSSSVYAGCAMPFTEEAALGKMQSPYAETKRQAEILAHDGHRQHGLDVSVLRYFTVFGPAGRPDMAPLRFIKWIDEGTPITLFGDGTQARDFTYVDDIARGTVLAGQLFGSQLSTLSSQPRGSVAPTYEVINLGGGRNPISIQAVLALIEKALGKKARINGQPPSAADMKETWADIAKAKALLGWEPRVSIEEGFSRTVEWHAANRDWLKEIKL
ncbi:MAG: NAD-dependent epimerase/dehydratase family protein [Opitutae bacterium]|nr:NAD-dependent epimerase/dehydratase family protein [Opitutae bacterium]